MIELKLSSFELSYDGVFKLRFNYKGRVFEKYLYLEPQDFLQLLKAECDTFPESMDLLNREWIPFGRSEITIGVFLNLDGSVDGFLTAELAEDWQNKGIFMIQMEI